MLSIFCLISLGASAADIPNNQIWYEASSIITETTSKYHDGLHTNAFNTTIKSHTFSNGKGIITFYAKVTQIGDYAFYCCPLISVTIPNSVTSIGDEAFHGCSFPSVTIPNSVKTIGDWAFSGCKNMSSATIPNSVTFIGAYAFEDCSRLESVIIGNSVTSIGEIVFHGCSALTSIVVESGNTVYDSRANCNAIIKTASNTLISGCKNTTIPYSVTSIGGDAFYDCSGLTNMTIPNSVKWIGNYAFDGCSGLTSIEIPNSVISIGYDAFFRCSGLTSIKVHWKKPISIDTSVWNGVDKQKCTLYVPEGICELYRGAPVWMDFVNIEEFSEEPGEEIYLTVMGVNGVILQQAVETGKTYKYLLDNKKNGKIVAVTFNGEDVTADVIDGKYTTPKITGNSEIYVEYDNQPLGDTNLDGNVNVNDITKTAEIILLRAKAEMEADRF